MSSRSGRAGRNYKAPAAGTAHRAWPWLLLLVPIALLWDSIVLPFWNPHSIRGLLWKLEYSVLNNSVRYALFIGAPAVGWLLFTRRARSSGVILTEASAPDSRGRWLVIAVALVAFAWAAAAGIDLFVSDLNERHTLDFLHDGDFLAPAFSYRTTGQLWTGGVLTRGPGNDVLPAVLGWRLAGNDSAGVALAMHHALRAVIPLAWCGIVMFLQYRMRRFMSPVGRAIFAAAAIAGPILYFRFVGSDFAQFGARELALLAWLAVFMTAVTADRPLWFVAAGATNVVALFTSTDAGIYTTATAAIVLAVFSISTAWRQRLHREVFPWLAGVVAGHASVAAFLGWTEYGAWIPQILSTASRWDFVYDLPYPSPLSAADWSTHGWPLVVIAVLTLTCVVALRRRSGAAFDSPQVRTHVTLVALAIICYRGALGRADINHVAQSVVYCAPAAAFQLAFWLSRRQWRAKWLTAALMLLVPAVALAVYAQRAADGAYNRLSIRTAAYLRAPDTSFLTPPQREQFRALQSSTAGQPCFFTFTNEPAWYFLLKKRSCSRFFITVHIAGTDYEAETIDELTRAAPRTILCATESGLNFIDGITNAERLPALVHWIQSSYVPHNSVPGAVICERRP